MIIPSFPPYLGPSTVGTREFEIPVSELPSSSELPKPGITTIKFRAFYPSDPRQGQSKLKSIYWLPEPQNKWVKAYTAFMGASPTIARLLSYVHIYFRSRVHLVPNVLKIFSKLPLLHQDPGYQRCPAEIERWLFVQIPNSDFLTWPGWIFQHIQLPSGVAGELWSCLHCARTPRPKCSNLCDPQQHRQEHDRHQVSSILPRPDARNPYRTK